MFMPNQGSKPDISDPNEALLYAVLETAIDAIIAINERGIIQQANHAVEVLFGYTVAEVVGKNVSLLMPEPDRSRHDQYLSRYQTTGEAAIIGIGREVMGQRKDGSLIALDLAVTEIHVAGQTMYAGILRDITQRNRVAADLKYAEQRLIQNERLAAIGQVVTGLAHESRNALQRSRACLDMLELDLESHEEQKDLVQRSRSALIELQRLYEEVQNYAAPIVLEKSTHNIGEICREVWGDIQDVRGPIPIELQVECGQASPWRIDKHRISQVLRNIFENSIAASQHDSKVYGTKIRVTCLVRHDNADETLELRILDEGAGLDAVQRERIFEPFYTTKSKGTGLGMAISQRIIEAHGGCISIGEPTCGTEIIIELPRRT